MTRARLAALAAATLLPACTAVIPLDLTREVPLQADAGAFDLAQPVDLTTSAAIWSRRSQVDAISVDEVTATVVSLGAGHAAASVDLALGFRADGAPSDGSQDLALGTFTGLPFVPGSSATLQGTPALDAFLLDALHGSGQFTVRATGTLPGAANAVLELRLKGSASYAVTSR